MLFWYCVKRLFECLDGFPVQVKIVSTRKRFINVAEDISVNVLVAGK